MVQAQVLGYHCKDIVESKHDLTTQNRNILIQNKNKTTHRIVKLGRYLYSIYYPVWQSKIKRHTDFYQMNTDHETFCADFQN